MFKIVRKLATSATTGVPKLQDIVIVGGGPAGLSLLAALKSSHKTKHLSCTLVEGGSLEGVRQFGLNPPDNYTNRVVSLTPQSVEFMQEKINSWQYINQDRIKFYDSIVAYDGQDKDARIQFDGIDAGSSTGGVLAVMCENLNIQSSLLERIEEIGDSTILDNTKVLDIVHANEPQIHDLMDEPPVNGGLDWPVVHLSNGETIQARLLVGADGYMSPVRKFSGIESRGWQYGRFGVVATIKMQYEDYRSIGWQRFLTTGPLAILPLTEDNATIVWSSTPELAEILTTVPPEIFVQLVNAAMTLDEVDLQYIYGKLRKDPNDPTVLEEIDWRMSKIKLSVLEEQYPLPVVEVIDQSRARFPLKMSHADTYIGPRVALIGDAAHTVHPLAGQGLNMGQSDVAALVNALEKGVVRGMDIGSTLVLDDYVATAYPANHVLIGVCDKLHKIFSTDFYPLVFLRGIGMKSLNMLDAVKDMMVKSMAR